MNSFHSFKELISFPIPPRFMVCLLKILKFKYAAEKRWGSIYITRHIQHIHCHKSWDSIHLRAALCDFFACRWWSGRYEQVWRQRVTDYSISISLHSPWCGDWLTDFECLKCPFSNLFWANSAEDNTSSSSAVDIFMNFSDPTPTYQSRGIHDRNPEPSWVRAAGWSCLIIMNNLNFWSGFHDCAALSIIIWWNLKFCGHSSGLLQDSLLSFANRSSQVGYFKHHDEII